MASAIGQPYAAEFDESSEHESVSDHTSSNSFSRTNEMWRNRKRGMSLTNKRDCDEIMR